MWPNREFPINIKEIGSVVELGTVGESETHTFFFILSLKYICAQLFKANDIVS